MSEEKRMTEFQKVVVQCLAQAGQIPPALLLEELGNRLCETEHELLIEIGHLCFEVNEEAHVAFDHFMHEMKTAPKLLVPK